MLKVISFVEISSFLAGYCIFSANKLVYLLTFTYFRSPQSEQPRSQVNVAEVTPVNFLTPTVQILTPLTPESLFRISLNFYKMYRNDYQLLA